MPGEYVIFYQEFKSIPESSAQLTATLILLGRKSHKAITTWKEARKNSIVLARKHGSFFC